MLTCSGGTSSAATLSQVGPYDAKCGKGHHSGDKADTAGFLRMLEYYGYSIRSPIPRKKSPRDTLRGEKLDESLVVKLIWSIDEALPLRRV
jgi:hypothetical protein